MLPAGVGENSCHPKRLGWGLVKDSESGGTAYPERYSTGEGAIQSGETSMNIAVWGQDGERCGEAKGWVGERVGFHDHKSFSYGEK